MNYAKALIMWDIFHAYWHWNYNGNQIMRNCQNIFCSRYPFPVHRVCNLQIPQRRENKVMAVKADTEYDWLPVIHATECMFYDTFGEDMK